MTVFGYFEEGPVPAVPQVSEPPQRLDDARYECWFEARYFLKFRDLADFEGGYIYEVSTGLYNIITGYDYDGFSVFSINTMYGSRQPSPSEQFLYSTSEKLSGQRINAPNA